MPVATQFRRRRRRKRIPAKTGKTWSNLRAPQMMPSVEVPPFAQTSMFYTYDSRIDAAIDSLMEEFHGALLDKMHGDLVKMFDGIEKSTVVDILALQPETDEGKKVYVGAVENAMIYLVDGDEIKKKFNADFVEGANDQASDFVPIGEIWIDVGQDQSRYVHIALHEVYERYLMKWKKLPYEKAHELANKAEVDIIK